MEINFNVWRSNDWLLPGIIAAGMIAFLLSLGLTPLARSLARRCGYVDHPGERKIHVRLMPYGGGCAICLTVLGLVLGIVELLPRLPAGFLPASLSSFLQPYQGGLALKRAQAALAALTGGGALMFLLGLIDDLYGLSPRFKLLVQFLAAGLLVVCDQRLTVFIDYYWVSVGLTLFWVVLVTNAFNLLDNMDGLSAGVAALAGSLLLVVAMQNGQVFVAAYLAVLVGALAGFMVFNFPPAPLFMGDAGSLFIGYTLAALTVTGTYYQGRGSVYAAALPVLILAVPLFDTCTVMWRRWRAGKPLFVGDANHFSHRLVRLGMSRRQTVLTIYLLTLILGAAATLLTQLNQTGAWTVLLIGLGVLAVISLLESAAEKTAAAPPESKTPDSGRPSAPGETDH